MPSWTSPVGTLACWCAYVPGDCHMILSVNWACGAIALSREQRLHWPGCSVWLLCEPFGSISLTIHPVKSSAGVRESVSLGTVWLPVLGKRKEWVLMVVHVLMEEGGRPFLGAALSWTSLKGGGVHNFSICTCEVQQGHVLRKRLTWCLAFLGGGGFSLICP